MESKNEEKEIEKKSLSHQEAMNRFEMGLAEIIKNDPLLSDLPICVTLEEVNSQIALEYGQAMLVIINKANGEKMPIVVEQKATVLDLKKGIRRYVTLKQSREGGANFLSWRYVWRTYSLYFDGQKLLEDNKKLRDYGIRNHAEVTFIKKLKNKDSIRSDCID